MVDEATENKIEEKERKKKKYKTTPKLKQTKTSVKQYDDCITFSDFHTKAIS